MLWAVVFTAACAWVLLHSRAPRPAPNTAPLITPPGITLEHVAGNSEEVFADARGLSLYVHVDAGGAPTIDCEPDCSSDRLPALAPQAASLPESWSLRAASAGQQWVYRGAALYRCSADHTAGDLGGKSAAWRPALYNPEIGLELRAGLSAREINDAGGTVLVTSAGLTLYVFRGDLREVRSQWLPLLAPAIAQRSAQLTVLDRSDGVSQWAYLGKPLFRFEDDTKPLDVLGIGVDPNFEVALVRRHFRPADVEIRRVLPWGDILTTAQGATLYQRDRVSTTNEGHDFREDHGSPTLGRSLGTATCVESCTQTWHPLLAPADALPSGHWDIALRPEGTRQWVYKGFALYTYANDTSGAALGNAVYDLAPVQSTPSEPSTLAPTGGSQDDGLSVHGIPQRVGGGISAFFWHAVVP